LPAGPVALITRIRYQCCIRRGALHRILSLSLRSDALIVQPAPPTVLSCSLSDPSGAGGVAADAITCAAMGCHGAAVVTVLTVRDSNRTHSVLAVESDFVGQQARAVLGDMNVAAIKIGAVGAPASALALAVILSDYPDLPVVFDPRLTASDEEGALENSADDDATHVRAWRALLPRARVCTLSLALARRWIGLLEDANSAAPLAPHECARQLLQWGARAVFLTAAASDNGRIVNQLFDGGVDWEGANGQPIPKVALICRAGADSGKLDVQVQGQSKKIHAVAKRE